MIEADKGKPNNFARKLRQLFAAMSTEGSTFGMHDIHWFNGGLFMTANSFASRSRTGEATGKNQRLARVVRLCRSLRSLPSD